jgi:hypothetical protein
MKRTLRAGRMHKVSYKGALCLFSFCGENTTITTQRSSSEISFNSCDYSFSREWLIGNSVVSQKRKLPVIVYLT